MIKLEVPINLKSSQRIELDEDGKEFILELRWINRYQRFYMDVLDSSKNPIIETLKIVPGAPINLGNLGPDGPQGVFIIIGSGDFGRRSFDQGSYRLYYLDRSDGKFPLERSYLVETTLNSFLLQTVPIEPPEPGLPVIFTVDTNLTGTGTTSSNQFKLPLIPTESYSFVVDWGDGNAEVIASPLAPEATHTYSVPGQYDITVSGIFPSLSFEGTGDAIKMIDWQDWGDIKLAEAMFDGCSNLTFSSTQTPVAMGSSLKYAFRNCSSIVSVPGLESLILFSVDSVEGMFEGCTSFTQDLSTWNVSLVSNLSSLFRACSSFNSNIGNWNIGSATRLAFMFDGASIFNQDLYWDTSNVTNAEFMFANAFAFNGDIDNWDTSSMIDVAVMFANATSFNRDITGWDVSSVISCGGMFLGATIFNQAIGVWDTSSFGTTEFMFQDAIAFNQDLSNWDTSRVEEMQSTFRGATAFNGSLLTWDTSNVERMDLMFNDCPNFNQPVSHFNTGNVTNFLGMFGQCSVFDQPVPFDTSSAETMLAMFSGCTVFSQSVATFNTSNVTNMGGMFTQCNAFNQPVDHFDVSNVTNFFEMFRSADSFNQPLTSWVTSSAVNMGGMLAGPVNFNQPIGHFITDNVTNMWEMLDTTPSFNQDISSWNIGQVTSMEGMLSGTAMSTANYDAWLVNCDSQTVQPNVSLGAQGLTYTGAGAGGTARNNLLANDLWIISGDSPV